MGQGHCGEQGLVSSRQGARARCPERTHFRGGGLGKALQLRGTARAKVLRQGTDIISEAREEKRAVVMPKRDFILHPCTRGRH